MFVSKITADMPSSIAAIAKQFEDWVDNRSGVSPLYDAVVRSLIKDPDLLCLVADAGDRPLIYNAFMGAVHYLLLEGPGAKLLHLYSAGAAHPERISEVYPEFRAFCFENRREILELTKSKKIQINEVRRCLALVPALAFISKLVRGSPLALIDVGACAGLNLNFDKYFYDYGAGGTLGPSQSIVTLECRVRGKSNPIVEEVPLVPWRLGIDSDPVDVTNSHETNWLVALVSPDDRKRLDLLRAALAIARQHTPKLVKGTVCSELADVLASAPAELIPCIFHSFTTHHLDVDELRKFDAIRNEYGKRRGLYSVSLEWEREGGQIQMRHRVPLKVTIFADGSSTEKTIALVDNRGDCELVEWLADR
jgi:hypothetical protein